MPISESTSRDIERAVQFLYEAKRCLFITGAGISADSGMPTYRGVAGLYNSGDTPDGRPIEEILTTHTLETEPELCWKYLAEIAHAAFGAKPNRGHEVIALLESRMDRVCVLTQNVDDLHRQAGSTNVLEIHGNMRRIDCEACDVELFIDPSQDETFELPPKCPKCGELMRPRVVLFGDLLPQEVLQSFYTQWEEGFDVVFSVGTSSLFPYIAAPVQWAVERRIPTVEINPGRSSISRLVAVQLPLGAAEALGEIYDRLEARG